MTMLDRIAAVMGCTPEDDEDLVEAVRLLVSERDEARADRARLLAYTDECGVMAVGLVERVHRALETHQGVVRELAAERTRRVAAEASATRSADAAVDAARELGHVAAAAVTRADAAEARLAALAEAVREERARCAAVCREVADIYRRSGCTCAECEGHREGARECAEEIECGEVGR
jgi:hypothetical protein